MSAYQQSEICLDNDAECAVLRKGLAHSQVSLVWRTVGAESAHSFRLAIQGCHILLDQLCTDDTYHSVSHPSACAVQCVLVPLDTCKHTQAQHTHTYTCTQHAHKTRTHTHRHNTHAHTIHIRTHHTHTPYTHTQHPDIRAKGNPKVYSANTVWYCCVKNSPLPYPDYNRQRSTH